MLPTLGETASLADSITTTAANLTRQARTRGIHYASRRQKYPVMSDLSLMLIFIGRIRAGQRGIKIFSSGEV